MTRKVPLYLETLSAGGETEASAELPRSGVLKIGSDAERCDYTLEGPGVAAVHCAIGRLKTGGWALKDLGSEHGTLVNGEPCSSVRLAAGDQIVLGSRQLRVVDRTPAPEPPRAPQRPSSSGAARSALTISGYRIGRLLGRGGMGEVYAAMQESLQRPVALKVVSAKFDADPEFVDRFLAEARAAAALSHPNVVTVHDVGEESGHHYLSMEFMEGGNLEERVAHQGRVPVAETITILTDAAKGLVFAELRGIVHRDIKPANLMRDGFGNTKIADLGLATQIEAQSSDEGERKIFGTPHFISPEQARGERVDCRSDLYSLGATLYRLLSGRTPFEGQTTREILRGHFQERPQPLDQLVPDVPPELARLVARLLEKDPADRFPSASALLLEIERLRSAPPPTPPERASPRLQTWIGAVLGLLAVSTVALVLWMVLPDEGPRADAGRAPRATEPSAQATPANPATGGEVPGAPGPEASSAAAASTPGAEAPQSGPRTPFDDDSALKALEQRAAEAYAGLPRDLTAEERRAELTRLAGEFAGTTAVTRWVEEIAELDRARSSSSAARTPASITLEALRSAATPAGQSLPLAESWPALQAVEIPSEVALDPTFHARRAALFDALLTGALERSEPRLAALDSAAAEGRFEEVIAGLEQALDALGDPTLPTGLAREQLPHLGTVEDLRASLQRRLADIDDEREDYRLTLVHRDATALAAGFGGAAGLERELARLDLAAAGARLEQLEADLGTPAAREFVGGLRATITGSQRALAGIAAEFGADQWRRKQMLDPRSKSRSRYSTLAVDSEGLVLEIGTAGERLPWAAFGSNPTALNHLFHERLTREYTPEELADIAGLVRTAAVVRAVALAAERLLDPGAAAAPEVSGAESDAGFQEARTWADLAGAPEPARREAAAVRAFDEALAAAVAGSWSRSVARLEELFDDYGDTLFVRLLSDGSAWEPATSDE